jgi:2-haloacid dehalogenase
MLASMIEFGDFDALTFDCFGTLIDWETGLLNALQPVLASKDVDASGDELLEAYAKQEAMLEHGKYLSYREILGRSVRRMCAELGVSPSEGAVVGFADSVGYWPAFPDTAPALRRLATRFKLGVITNCDDDLFARANERLGVRFDWIVTAAQARNYKPSHKNFELAFKRIDVPRDRVLHVAQSLYHDHVPAKELGMTTVWVNRRHDRPGAGATPPAEATPDLTVPDMSSLAELAVL